MEIVLYQIIFIKPRESEEEGFRHPRRELYLSGYMYTGAGVAWRSDWALSGTLMMHWRVGVQRWVLLGQNCPAAGLLAEGGGAWRWFTLALPPEMSFEQRLLRLKL